MADPIDIRIRDEALQRYLRQFPDRAEGALDLALQRLAMEAARELRRDAPKAFSTLTQSIKDDKIGDLEYEAGPHVAYAEFVVQGRQPGGRMPPLSAIADWVRVRQLGTPGKERSLAWAIARKIATQGTPPNDFQTPVFERMEPRAQQLAVQYLRREFGV